MSRGSWRMIGACAAALAILVGTMTTAGTGQALQVGAKSTDPGNAFGVRGYISQPSQRVHGYYTRVYWISVTFLDGTFFQAGYEDAGYYYNSSDCQTGFSTFVTYKSPGYPYSGYNNANCGITGSQWFTLVRSNLDAYGVDWQWYLQGTPVGPLIPLSASNGYGFRKSSAYALTELVDTTNAPAQGTFPAEEYHPAIEFGDPATGNWSYSVHGSAARTSDAYCGSGYGLKPYGVNAVQTGRETEISPPACYNDGDPLW